MWTAANRSVGFRAGRSSDSSVGVIVMGLQRAPQRCFSLCCLVFCTHWPHCILIGQVTLFGFSLLFFGLHDRSIPIVNRMINTMLHRPWPCTMHHGS
jgi:hypothetical protein